MPNRAPPGPRERVALWDRPVRLVHWTTAGLFALMWWTGKTGRTELHVAAGLTLMALLMFRLIWGVVGSDTARFASFVRGPGTVARYAWRLATGREQAHAPGHNPMGGWSVVALLALLSLVTTTGLLAEDTDGVASGPLAFRASYDVTHAAAVWHGRLFDALLVLVALHLAAIAFYAVVRRDDLVSPMLRGTKPSPAGTAPMRPAAWPRLVMAATAAGALALWTAYGLRPL